MLIFVRSFVGCLLSTQPTKAAIALSILSQCWQIKENFIVIFPKII